MNAKHREESLTREILETIHGQSDMTQRHLADRLGVALGLANSYLKRCVRKGLIKIEQAPANRYLYYLTPRGFAEKSRLTAEFLSSSFDFYRQASASCADVFESCRQQGLQSILLCGASELAEIASLRAKEQNIHISGIFDDNAVGSKYLGMPVFRSFDDINGFDACVITDFKDPMHMISCIKESISDKRILVPDILGIEYQ